MIDFNIAREAAELADELAKATQALYDATEAKIEADNDLEAKTATAYYQGDIVGKNEKEREGAARTQFKELYEVAERADKAFRLAQHNWKLAQIRYDHIKIVVRIIEATNRP